MRFTKNGKVDSSFGFKGVKAFKFERSLEAGGTIVQPDYKILVQSYSGGAGNTGLYLIRFMPNGSV